MKKIKHGKESPPPLGTDPAPFHPRFDQEDSTGVVILESGASTDDLTFIEVSGEELAAAVVASSSLHRGGTRIVGVDPAAGDLVPVVEGGVLGRPQANLRGTNDESSLVASVEEEVLGLRSPGQESIVIVGEVQEQQLDVDPGTLEPYYLVHSPENHRLVLLEQLHDSLERYADLAVFCSDGVAFASRFLLASASPTLRDILLSPAEAVGTCLVVPDITKAEFETFQLALFTPMERNARLDLMDVIKVAELFYVEELPITTNAPISLETLPSVNYKAAKADPAHWLRALRAMGHDDLDHRVDAGGGPQVRPSEAKSLSDLLNSSVECPVCKSCLSSEAALKNHVDLVHRRPRPTAAPPRVAASSSRKGTSFPATRIPSYGCSKCNATFRFGVNLRKHQWLSHDLPERAATEAESLRMVLSQDAISLDDPQVAAGGEASRQKVASRLKQLQEKYDDMRCAQCGKRFTTWKKLEIHMMDHRRERPFTCQQCGKGFKEAQKLDRHQLTHTKAKDFECHECGKRFGLKHNMLSHAKVHQGKGFSCGFCGRTFSQRMAMLDHEKKHGKHDHVRTLDDDLRRAQIFNTKKGRPSLMDLMLKGHGTSAQDASSTGQKPSKARAVSKRPTKGPIQN